MIILDTSDSHTTLGVISSACNHLMSIHLSLSIYLSVKIVLLLLLLNTYFIVIIIIIIIMIMITTNNQHNNNLDFSYICKHQHLKSRTNPRSKIEKNK